MAAIPYPAQPSQSIYRFPATLNAFRLISHAETLIGPTVDLGIAILTDSALTPRHRELVVMTVARTIDCPYELAQHTPIALDAGLTPGQPSTDADLAVTAAVRELLRTHTMTAPVIEALGRHFDHRQTVEIALITGYYVMLAGVMNGLRVDIDPQGEKFINFANHP
ncbi:carboxymuconolactone decarboxylase family protein [Streptomyces sp. NPDC050355]|uniref:carboxymuconolactone decarboxylase family protein n=1 Tax=Streptomyces sp. NPDC050355 TaxID=3365609 RepID=UPI003788583D